MINFTIILADDEQQILYGMKNGIDWESLGFSVVGTAQNGKEALELIEEHHPDLLISDIKMPFMDGLELSKTIHENYINTKIILFSGWDDFEYARTAISYGVSQYIMKPIDYNEMQKLLTTMHEELEKEYADFFATQTELTTLIYSYQVSPDYYIYEMKLPPAFVGRRLGDIKLEKDFSLKLIAIKHYDRDEEKGYLRMELLEEVSDDFVVNANDVFILFGKRNRFRVLSRN